MLFKSTGKLLSSYKVTYVLSYVSPFTTKDTFGVRTIVVSEDGNVTEAFPPDIDTMPGLSEVQEISYVPSYKSVPLISSTSTEVLNTKSDLIF